MGAEITVELAVDRVLVYVDPVHQVEVPDPGKMGGLHDGDPHGCNPDPSP